MLFEDIHLQAARPVGQMKKALQKKFSKNLFKDRCIDLLRRAGKRLKIP